MRVSSFWRQDTRKKNVEKIERPPRRASERKKERLWGMMELFNKKTDEKKKRRRGRKKRNGSYFLSNGSTLLLLMAPREEVARENAEFVYLLLELFWVDFWGLRLETNKGVKALLRFC